MAVNVLNYKGSLVGHNGWVTSIAAASTDGSKIVTGSRDKSIIVWKLNDVEGNVGHAVKRLTGHNGPVSDVTLAAEGQYALSASWDKTIRLWDLTKGVCAQQLVGHESDVLSVAFSPDQRSIVSSSRDKTIRIWNIVGQNKKTLKASDGCHDDWIPCVRFSPSAKSPMICSASWDKTIKLWNAANAEDIKLSHTLTGHATHNGFNGHTGPINHLTVSPDGTLCASGGKDGKAILWDVANAEVFYDLAVEDTINALAFSPKNYWLCVATDNSIQVWDLENRKRLTSLTKKDVTVEEESFEEKKTKEAFLPWIVSCAWSADGNKLFAGTSTNEVLVFDVKE